MNSFGCIVLDIDDTLYLERDYIRSGFRVVGRYVQEQYGPGGFFDIAWESFQCGARGTIFNEALGALRMDATPELIAELVTVYRKHTPQIEMLSDAAEFIGRLHGQVALAAISDGPLQSQRAKTEALGLAKWMDLVILTAELGEGLGKPHPRAFEMIQQHTGRTGSECVYVADNPTKDFIAPASLGWKTVRIRRLGGLHHEIESTPDIQHEMSDMTLLFEFLSLR